MTVWQNLRFSISNFKTMQSRVMVHAFCALSDIGLNVYEVS